LHELLGNGPLTTRDLWAAAREGGVSASTLFRARHELDIRSEQVFAGGKRDTYWLLPGQRLRDVLPPEEVVPDLEEWLAPLRERYPTPTPLDEV
jgi:hypothetical protein